MGFALLGVVTYGIFQAVANQNSDASDVSIIAPSSIKAHVNESSSTITFDDGFLRNNSTNLDTHIKTISINKAEGADDGDCTWTMKAFDETLYSDKAGNSVTLPEEKVLEPGDSTILKFESDISLAKAKALIGAKVISVSFDYEEAEHPQPGPEPTDYNISFNVLGNGSIGDAQTVTVHDKINYLVSADNSLMISSGGYIDTKTPVADAN